MLADCLLGCGVKIFAWVEGGLEKENHCWWEIGGRGLGYLNMLKSAFSRGAESSVIKPPIFCAHLFPCWRLGLMMDELTEVAIGAALTAVAIAIMKSESLILLSL